MEKLDDGAGIMKKIISQHPMWIENDKIFYTPKYFGNEISPTNPHERTFEMIGMARSKFPKLKIYSTDLDMSYSEDNDNTIISIAALGDVSVRFLDLDKQLEMSIMDIVAFYNDINFEISGEYYIKKLRYSIKDDVPGSGDKMFEVTATIRDEYRIRVRANSSDEAIELANSIEISEWEHPDIEPHLVHRKIIRHARWGNLMATETK